VKLANIVVKSWADAAALLLLLRISPEPLLNRPDSTLRKGGSPEILLVCLASACPETRTGPGCSSVCHPGPPARRAGPGGAKGNHSPTLRIQVQGYTSSFFGEAAEHGPISLYPHSARRGRELATDSEDSERAASNLAARAGRASRPGEGRPERI
jgi:hypothetical protein